MYYIMKNEANYDFNGKCEEKESGTVQFSVLKTGSLQEIYEKHKENKTRYLLSKYYLSSPVVIH